MAEVFYHPMFDQQLDELEAISTAEDYLWEWLAEVSALLRALQDHGHEIEGAGHGDASHPIVTSRFEMYALRRTPPTVYTPYANSPPILRIPYVWFDVAGGGEVAVVMLVGDKTRLGNAWYPQVVQQIENVMIAQWRRANPGHHPQVRRAR